MRILVTGGAGYIGAITTHELVKAGHEVAVFDRKEEGIAQAKLGDIQYIQGNLLDPNAISSAIDSLKPDAVIHFAADIQMGESVLDPQKYYTNNVFGSYNLASACIEHGVDKIVFSSSAGVYGNPESLPIPEDACKTPTNPYGETKLVVERMLRWFETPYDLRSICIRYFNAAGATDQLGEDHEPESHLIPNIIRAQQQDKEFTLFGDDYPTPDGTCIRDYIHVADLASAHIKALEALSSGAKSAVYNAGTGTGYSNKQVIEMVEKVSGKPVKVKAEPRRAGDANELVADVTKIKEELNWSPEHSDLETIIRTAYEYHQRS